MTRSCVILFGVLGITSIIPGGHFLEVDSLQKECPDKWLKYGEWCYRPFYQQKNLSWFEASLLCEVNYGYLAEPSNAQITDFLYELGILFEEVAGVTSWYLGLTDMAEEGNWRCPYSTQAPDTFYWGFGKPDTSHGNSLDCSLMTLDQGNFYWEDIGCVEAPGGKLVAPLCQRKKQVVEGCPEGFTPYGFNCYQVGANRLDFESAEAYCQEAGGHLASVHSDIENQFLTNLTGGFDRYLGAELVVDESTDPWTWRWLDGSEFTFHGTWYAGQPTPGDTRIFLEPGGAWYGVANTYTIYPLCKVAFLH